MNHNFMCILCYPTDGYPPDGTPIVILSTINIALTAVCYSFTICGLVLAIVCFIFNFVFRNRRQV